MNKEQAKRFTKELLKYFHFDFEKCQISCRTPGCKLPVRCDKLLDHFEKHRNEKSGRKPDEFDEEPEYELAIVYDGFTSSRVRRRHGLHCNSGEVAILERPDFLTFFSDFTDDILDGMVMIFAGRSQELPFHVLVRVISFFIFLTMFPLWIAFPPLSPATWLLSYLF